MGYFAADLEAMESVVSALTHIQGELDELADTTWLIATSVSQNKTLNDFNYTTKVRDASTSIEMHGTSASEMASKLNAVVELYRAYDAKVSETISDFSISTSDFESKMPRIVGWVFESNRPHYASMGALVTGAVQNAMDAAREEDSSQAFEDAFKKGIKDTWEQLKAAPEELDKLIKHGRAWRSAKGGEIVEGLFDLAGTVHPGLRFALEKVVADKNKKVTNYENMVSGFLHPTDIDVLARGAESFADELGFGWVPGVCKRLDERKNQYIERGTKQILEGQVAKGVVTALGGSLLAFGDAAVDTMVKTAKWVVKADMPGVKEVLKVVNGFTEYKTGSTAEDLVDKVCGSVGSGLKRAFDWFTR